MSEERLENAIVRIRSAEGDDLCGAGAYIGSKTHADGTTSWYVLTCAHVAADAIGINNEERESFRYSGTAPEGNLNVDFPLIAPNSQIPANVMPEYWRPVVKPKDLKDDSPRDVAVLSLLMSPPEEAQPIPTTQHRDVGRHFYAYGVPRGADRGTYARGDVKGRVAYGDVEIGVVDLSNEKTFVEEGFSGSPAWHDEYNAMFGMVAEVRRPHHAYVRPITTLQRVWPDIDPVDAQDKVKPAPRPDVQSVRLPKKIPYARLHSVDRTVQKEKLRDLKVEHPSENSFKPWLFLLSGAFEENPGELVPHFSRRILSRYGISSGATGLNDFPWVPWSNPETGTIDARIQEIILNLSTVLGTDTNDIDGIRKALEDPQNINVVAWEIPAGTLDGPEVELIDRWFHLWNDIARGGLTRPVAIFMCFVYYEKPQLGVHAIRRLWKETAWAAYSEMTVQPLDEITPFSVERIETWCGRTLPVAAGVQRRNLPTVTNWITQSMPTDPVTWTEFYKTLDEMNLIAREA